MPQHFLPPKASRSSLGPSPNKPRNQVGNVQWPPISRAKTESMMAVSKPCAFAFDPFSQDEDEVLSVQSSCSSLAMDVSDASSIYHEKRDLDQQSQARKLPAVQGKVLIETEPALRPSCFNISSKSMSQKSSTRRLSTKKYKKIRKQKNPDPSLSNKKAPISNSITPDRIAVTTKPKNKPRLASKPTSHADSSASTTIAGDFFVYSENSSDLVERAGCRLLNTAVLPIQCLVRVYLARYVASRRAWAVVVLQGLVRGGLIRSQLQRTHQAAIFIQSAFRGYVASFQYRCDLIDIITVQSVCRQKLARLECERMIERLCWNHAASLIKDGLEIMGVDFGELQSMDLEYPSQETLLQIASLINSLRME